MAYHGDSLAKEAVRSTAYSMIEKRLSNGFWTKKHIVLAGDCGDIKTLYRYGVDVENIIACDCDSKALDRASDWGVFIPSKGCDDLVETVRWAVDQYGINQIGSINADLCGTLQKGIPILKDIRKIVGKKIPTLFTFIYAWDGFYMGKEAAPGNARKAFLTKAAGKPKALLPYQSRTRASYGSPMCVAVFT